MSGSIRLAMAEQLEQLDASLSLQPGRLLLDGDSELGLYLEQGELQLELIEDTLNGDMLVRFEQDGEISSNWSYGPLPDEQPQLKGDLRTRLPDLSLLADFVPVLNELAGSLNMHAQFEGPLPQPLIALDIDLRDGRIVYAPVGLVLHDINLQGQSEPGQPFNGSGGLRAGDGQASMQFRLAPLKRTAELSIQGDSLQLADSQVLQLKISPDLSLSAAPEGFTIDGELLIPQALLQPPKQVTTQQGESADVVIVGAEQPAAKEQPQTNLNGKLKLVLGDDVRVKADVASTRLQGAVNLLWSGEPVPQADGSIEFIDGKVEAYGQTLNLRDSRVSYNESPADNPRLDIYAVRRIFGDPAVSEAGVAITGQAQKPNIRLFTNPASSEERRAGLHRHRQQLRSRQRRRRTQPGPVPVPAPVRQLRHRPVRQRQRHQRPLRTQQQLERHAGIRPARLRRADQLAQEQGLIISLLIADNAGSSSCCAGRCGGF